MASQRVHGITIDIDVNTNGVAESFKDIKKSLNQTTSELRTVDKLLKEDANNTTLLAQKQNLLADAIEKTKSKLEQLEKAKNKADQDSSVDKNSREYRELERDIEFTRKSLEKLEGQQKDTNTQMNNAEHSIQNVGDAMDDASAKAIKFGDIIKANIIADFIIDGLKELANAAKEFAGELNDWANGYRELEVYEKQFESNLKNTADASDEEIASLKKLAKQKERNGVISAKAITSGYQELATYVENAEAIEGLTDVLVDMSAQQYGIDATEESVRNIATTIGKALANGDYSGLTRLGYGFTDTQMRIMKYGTEAQRVAVINDVVSASIGGMNEALAETDAGQLFQVKSYFDDVKESVGQVVSELELGFIQQVLPVLQPFIDDGLKWIIDNKDNFIEIVQSVAEWLTSEDMQEFYKDVGQLAVDIGTILSDLGDILTDSGLLPAAWELFKTLVEGIRDIVHAIAEDIATIRGGGLGNWMMGNYNSYYPGTFDVGPMSSGGMMSGSITLNNTFTINNGNSISRETVMQWADVLTDRINENLGRMV